jgi:hypothetical protein
MMVHPIKNDNNSNNSNNSNIPQEESQNMILYLHLWDIKNMVFHLFDPLVHLYSMIDIIEIISRTIDPSLEILITHLPTLIDPLPIDIVQKVMNLVVLHL